MAGIEFWESSLGGNALYYARARWYDPRTKRFMSPDPLGVAAGLNPYVFAGNDPMNLSDPWGWEKCAKKYEEQGYQSVQDENTGKWWCYKPGAGHQLPGVTITGTQGPNWPNPFSPNFGDPCARGGRCGGGYTAGGGSAAYRELATNASAVNWTPGSFPELEMRQRPAWIGCKNSIIQFASTDRFGQPGKWHLARQKIVRGGVPIRGKRIPYEVGIYGGRFQSSSYVGLVPAFGQVFCQVGLGMFEATPP